MLFRKKPKADIRYRAADAIESVLMSGKYYNGTMGDRFMCIALWHLVDEGVMSITERQELADFIVSNLDGKKTLIDHLESYGVDILAMDTFEARITLSNWWWRFIRILRIQPFQDTRHD